MGPVLILVVIGLILWLIVSNIYVVQQSRAYVIERLGAFQAVQGVGLHLKVPFVDRIARRVSLKEQVLDYPPQPVITKDNVTMQIDTVVYFQITDPKLYTYGVEQPMMAMETLTATGQVKLGAMEWTARSTDGKAIAVGTVVRVDNIEGVKVYVSPAEIPANV